MCEETGDWPLDIVDLLRFSFQVAQGLDFLAAKNVSELIRGLKGLNVNTSNKEHFFYYLQLQRLSLESR